MNQDENFAKELVTSFQIICTKNILGATHIKLIKVCDNHENN